MQQMTNHRPLAELDLLDDFLFNALLAYPEYGRKFCRKFLKILFGREFKNLNIVTQKSYGGRDTGLHGARLDVYIEEGDEVEIDSSNVSTVADAIREQLIENRFIQLMSIYRSKKSKGELYKHAICKAQIIVSYVKGSTYFT